MNKLLWLVIAVIVIGGFGYYTGFDVGFEEAVDEVGETTEELEAEAVQTAKLEAIPPYTGDGVATRSYEDGMFIHTVTADIADPAVGKFYEGWLVMPTASGPQFFSTGKLEAENGLYTLTYTATKDYTSHSKVVITEETSAQGLDNNPEDHVLEGTF